ncbi:MAG TPA: T9SS type A sorting domain-containing protein, partial [Chitinophagaceae bacterium]
EYSLNGKAWTRLGNYGEGTNWYNKNYTGRNGWSVENYNRWHVATIPLPAGAVQLQLRFVMESDPAVNKEGIAIDDIHIYDNTYGIYDGETMAAPVTKNISGGAGWIDFTSGGKLIASVKPGSKNMGNTAIRSYINSNPVRTDSGHYYHDRNITIQPTNYVDDSVRVRFYFLDSESESLIKANGCANCIKPLHTYQLGVAGYDDIDDDAENGTIDDNVKGSWSFIPRSELAMVPFDKGYYADFSVNHFSEFWLKKEPFKRAVLPVVKITSFNAFKKQGNDVSVEWITSAEGNANRFEIEVAKGNEALQVNNFVKIGEIASRANSSQPQNYVFLDKEQKTDVRYYRLKIINNDGSFFYTDLKAVVFDNKWGAVFPNPSSGNFNIQFQLVEGTNISAVILDGQGRQVKKVQAVATGFQQKLNVNLEAGIYPAGLYVMRIESGPQRIIYKVVKY